jgi:hypothetical protein
MSILRRLRVGSPQQRQPTIRQPGPDWKQLAIDTLTAKGTPRAVALVQEIDRGRQRSGENCQCASTSLCSSQPSTRPMGDEDVLKMLSGANFGPKATLTLPSGEAIDGDEAQVWTAFYSDRDNRPEPHAP